MKDFNDLNTEELEDLIQESDSATAAAAAHELSERYKEGRNADKNEELAELWAAKARELGYADDTDIPSDTEENQTEAIDSRYNDYIAGKYTRMTIPKRKELADEGDLYACLSLGEYYSANNDFEQASKYFERVKSSLESSSGNENLLYSLNISLGNNYRKIAESRKDSDAIKQAVACYRNALDLDASKNDPKRYKYLLSVFNDYNFNNEDEIDRLNRLDSQTSSEKCIELSEKALKVNKTTKAVELLQLCLESEDVNEHPEAVAIARLLLGDLNSYDSNGEIPDINTEIQKCAEFLNTEHSGYIMNHFPAQNYGQLVNLLSKSPEYEDFCWNHMKFKPASDAMLARYSASDPDIVSNLDSDKVNILLNLASENKTQLLRSLAASGNAYAASIIREEREKREREEAERIRQAAIQQQQEFEKKQAEEAKKKTRKKITLIGSVIAAITFIAIIIVSTIVFKPIQVDPFPYVNVSYEGLNGYGKPTVNIDTAGFAVEAGKDTGNKPFTAKVSPSKGLSNGDKVTVALKPGDSLSSSRVKLEKSIKTFTVSGLQDAEPVDVFKDISVEFTGLDGSGSAKVVNNSTNPFVKKLTFKAEPDSGLKSGETVTVTVKADEKTITEYQKVPSVKEKTFTVDALEKYPDDINEISADSFQSISDEYAPQLKNYMLGSDNYIAFAHVVGKVSDGDWYFLSGYADTHVVDSIKLVKAYLIQSKNNDSSVHSQNESEETATNYKNIMFLVYEVNGHAGKSVGKGYVTVQYSDITIDPQGNIKSISKDSTLDSETSASSSVENAYNDNIAEFANSGIISERNF